MNLISVMGGGYKKNGEGWSGRGNGSKLTEGWVRLDFGEEFLARRVSNPGSIRGCSGMGFEVSSSPNHPMVL